MFPEGAATSLPAHATQTFDWDWPPRLRLMAAAARCKTVSSVCVRDVIAKVHARMPRPAATSGSTGTSTLQVPMTPSFAERTNPNADVCASGTCSRSIQRRSSSWPIAFASFAVGAALLLTPESASAQQSPVTPDGKGVVGGALLGAEVVDLTLGIIGINAGWPYLVFGAVGAAGGGVGGYFIEQETRDVPEVSLYMLAGGMALVIPTIVVSLNATMYKPPDASSVTTLEPADNQPALGPTPAQPPARTVPAGAVQNTSPSKDAVAQRWCFAPQCTPARTSSVVPTRRALTPPLRRAPREEHFNFSLVGLRKGQLAFSLPAVAVQPLYTSREMWTYGVSQGSEVRIPLFQASF